MKIYITVNLALQEHANSILNKWVPSSNDEEDEDIEEDSLAKEIETLKEEKIRLLAEMENLRKRFEREKIETIKFGSINLARDILSPGDNLERALDALPEDENHPESIKNLIDGLKMVLKEYKKYS